MTGCVMTLTLYFGLRHLLRDIWFFSYEMFHYVVQLVTKLPISAWCLAGCVQWVLILLSVGEMDVM